MVLVNADRVVAEANFTTPPESLPRDGLSFLVGSCTYGFSTHSSWLQSFDPADYDRETAPGGPLFDLLVGDNIYLDVPMGRRFGSNALDESVARYLRTWMGGPTIAPAAASFVSSRARYTTWDDHEFWNNYPEDQPHLWRSSGFSRSAWKAAAVNTLDFFQTSLNPKPLSHRSYAFRSGGIPFFVMDSRADRTHKLVNGRRGSLAPRRVIDAFHRWCGSLTSPGFLVTGQPLWDDEGSKFDYTPADFPEFALIWESLSEAKHDVMIVSGDVHHSRLLEINLGKRSIYELVSSPVCHIPSKPRVLWDYLRRPSEPGQQPPKSTSPSAVHALKLGSLGTARFHRYLGGSACPLTAALVTLLPRSPTSIDVRVAFCDLTQRGQVASSHALKVKRPWYRSNLSVPAPPSTTATITLR